MRLAIFTGFLVLVAVAMWVGQRFQLSPGEAVAVMMLALAPPCYAAGRVTRIRWFTRVSIALALTAPVMWLTRSFWIA